MPSPASYLLNTTHEVTIEKVVFGGQGLARLAEGFVLFVPYAAEGETVRVRITERKAQHGVGEILELLTANPQRVIPPCPVFTRCGGCQYQHVAYSEECRLKENQVREAFTRVGKLPDANVLPLIASPQPYGYRNRITVHAEGGRVGFRATNGRDLVDVQKCFLGNDEVNAELKELRSQGPREGHYSLRDAHVPPSGFFQANPLLHEALRQLVASALPPQGRTLLEGYCGGGFFTELLAPRFEQVLAVDHDRRTLIDARRLDLPNVEWHEDDAAELLAQMLPRISPEYVAETSVLLDPPREGLPVILSEALANYPVGHLVYVSCDPATLARDARVLSRRYQLVSVQPIDLFPRTAQIECVSTWRRRV